MMCLMPRSLINWMQSFEKYGAESSLYSRCVFDESFGEVLITSAETSSILNEDKASLNEFAVKILSASQDLSVSASSVALARVGNSVTSTANIRLSFKQSDMETLSMVMCPTHSV